MPFRQSGARGNVFNVQEGERHWALKVFNPSYRTVYQSNHCAVLNRYKSVPGLYAAERIVILPDDPIAQTYPDLKYALLMPWINGRTWSDLMFSVKKGAGQFDASTSARLCHQFLQVMNALEERKLAHTDIASGNVIVDLTKGAHVELIDLEEMFGDGLPPPDQKNRGSSGYHHPSLHLESHEGRWSADADRFAVAVLAAEMLAYGHADLVSAACEDNSFFEDRDLQADTHRSRLLIAHLRRVYPAFAALFERAWQAPSVGECPPIHDLWIAFDSALRTPPHVVEQPRPPQGPVMPVTQPYGYPPGSSGGAALPAERRPQWQAPLIALASVGVLCGLGGVALVVYVLATSEAPAASATAIATAPQDVPSATQQGLLPLRPTQPQDAQVLQMQPIAAPPPSAIPSSPTPSRESCGLSLFAGEYLDVNSPANFGGTAVTSGFWPDPWSHNLTAGGGADGINVRALFVLDADTCGRCGTSFVTRRPDFNLNFVPGLALVRFYVITENGADATLLINQPDSRWRCNDDHGRSDWGRPQMPVIDFHSPQPGRYDVWVGTYDRTARNPARLYVTELEAVHP